LRNVKSIRNILKKEDIPMFEACANTVRIHLYKYNRMSVKGGQYHEK